MSAEVRSTLGAALAGCMAAVGLSALVGFQTFLYFHIFPSDATRYKVLVGWIWITDAVHTVLVCTSVWDYTIVNFADPLIARRIFPTIAMTVSMTAIITLSVNTFYGWRIYKLSKHNWWITGPIALLSVARVGLAFTTTVEMFKTGTFPEFASKFKILFTSGLFLSAITDVLVSVARYYYLRNLKQGYSQTQEVVDSVVVYTINDGLLTCAVVIASIVCWLSMSHNFVYLGIYFTIAKFYSNSVLATLNLRNWFRHHYNYPRPMDIVMTRANGFTGVHVSERPHTTMMPTQSSDTPSHSVSKPPVMDIDGSRGLEVVVDRQVEYNVGDFDMRDDISHSSRKSVTMNIA
ncbi:hypothetical protein OF83DRAFT_809511 [Amylostereum chailletii]|nr:hypothetical protein OF83DRAFT_809511 [Amylostereum chailletii]